MAYLLDANVFIRAKRDHYRFGVFPCFWDWIVSQHGTGKVFSVKAVEKELLDGGDDLPNWISGIAAAFLEPDQDTVLAAQRVTAWAQDPARIYTPAAIAEFFASADYWLIAHAAAHGFTVITHEVPEPLAKRKVKIPDVCNALGVPWMNTFQMLQDEGANFVTSP